jgi:hypothetical protein
MTINNHLPAQEAANPRTASQRLRELSNDWSDLCPIIARNPNCDFLLINDLALSHPKDTLSNPALCLSSTGDGDEFTKLSLKALVNLCMFCSDGENSELLGETKSRIAKGIHQLGKQGEASMSYSVQCKRKFTLTPRECNNLIGAPIDFELEVAVWMEGSGPISVSRLPDITAGTRTASNKARQELAMFLSDIASGKIFNYFSNHEIICEDRGDSDCKIRASNLPEGLAFDGNCLFRSSPEGSAWDELLFEIVHEYGDISRPVYLQDGYLHVPVQQVEQTDPKYDVQMGELNQLEGTEVVDHEQGLVIDWPSRLAELLVPL